jgi:hypothetical protein
MMSILQGLSSYNNRLYAAWKGESNDDRLFFTYLNGTAWEPQAQIPGVGSGTGPSLAAAGNALYAVWKGEQSDQRLFYSSFNGSSWSPQAQIPGVASSVGPSLGVVGKTLYAAWKGEAYDSRLFYASFDGTSWSGQNQIPNTGSAFGPSLAAYDDKLYAAWRGEGGDQQLYFASLSGSNWSPQAQIPGVASSVGPSLAAYGNKLYAVWKGEAGDERLWFASFDGQSWSGQSQIPNVGSSIGPALAEYNGNLYAMWKGEAGDPRIFYSCYNGSSWTPQATLPGNTAPDVIRIVSIPDIHLETTADAQPGGTPTGQPSTWKAQAKWIANNQATYNVQAVLFVGDVQISVSGEDDLSTDMPNAWNWGFSAIDGMNLPYLVSPGNHDYDNLRDTTYLDQYIGYSRICQKPWWVGYWDAPGWPPVTTTPGTPPAPPTGNPSKATEAIRVDVGSRQLLVIALEYFPRQGALDWAGGIIAGNPACDVIILTHAYMLDSGALYDLTNGSPGPDNFWTPGATTGTQLLTWAQGFPNVHLVLCGHNVPSPILPTTLNDAHRVDTANDGHPILGVYADYQYAVPPTVLTSQVVLLLELSETQLNVRAFNTTSNVELSNTNYPYSLAWT